ncbi:MAG: hypothetical protein ACE5HV_07905, partial [Acidobacteriota bacterium]
RTARVRLRPRTGARLVLVMVMVLGNGVAVAGLGLALGLAGAGGLTRLLTSMLFEVEPTDPTTFAAVAILIGAVAVAAAWGPARRATRVDPVTALRND